MVSKNNGYVPTACAALLLSAVISTSTAQENSTPNGIEDERSGAYAFTNANIYQANGSMLNGGTLLIREGFIVELNEEDDVPDGYFEINLDGRYIYPGFIDIYTDYQSACEKKGSDPDDF